jgi:nucleotide-binding universal stress UspA family protein
MQTLRTILHPSDFSDLAANALHAALGLAQSHNAQLILLYVKQPQEVAVGEYGMTPPEPEPSDEEILARLRKLVPSGTAVKVEALVAHGNVDEAIVDVAKKKRCDLIVLGSHGRKGLARFFHHEVADRITRAAPCPVMALRSSDTEAHA